MYAKAIYVDGKIVTGRHHGEAYGMLSESEKCSSTLLSGFFDESTCRFFCEEQSFYTKSVYLVRHSCPSADYAQDDDPDLSQEGIEKAYALADFLGRANIGDYHGFTSPYLRCLITADIISRITGIQFVVSQSLAEPVEYDTVLENHAKDFPQFAWQTSEDFQLHKEDAGAYSVKLKGVAEALPASALVVTHYTPIACLAQLVSGTNEAISEAVPLTSVTHINNNKIVHFGKQV